MGNLLKQLSKLMMGDTNISDLFSSMFRGELNPVAPKAQKRVPVPEGLDLDKWINDPPSSSSESEEEDVRENVRNNFYLTSEKPKRAPELSPEQVKKIREARKAEQASNPHYLQAKVAKAAVESGYQKPDLEQESDKSSEVSDISTKFSKMRTSEQYLKFIVVERIGESASLFSNSIQNHLICLLVKKLTNGISIEGKSNNQSILSNVID